MNDEQRAVFANIFDEIDLNRDGWIDMKEFKGKLCSMATKDQLKQLLQVPLNSCEIHPPILRIASLTLYS